MRRPLRVLPTQDQLRERYVYCPESGVFTRRVNSGKRWKVGTIAGADSGNGYVNINFDRTIFRAHRLAWVYMTGSPPSGEIDHINGNPSDNRWCNLRSASHQQNICNKSRHKKKALPKGVFLIKKNGRFQSKISSKGRIFALGCFDTSAEAKAAYDAAAMIIHGDFSRS